MDLCFYDGSVRLGISGAWGSLALLTSFSSLGRSRCNRGSPLADIFHLLCLHGSRSAFCVLLYPRDPRAVARGT